MPSTIQALVFDIDLTLYEHHEYYKSQEMLLVRRLAEHLGLSLEETRQKVTAVRAQHKLSLGNTFLRFGVSLATNVQWREQLFQPEDYLQYDAKLVETMESLAARFKLSAVTNNATSIAKRTLRILGVEQFFPLVIGLDLSGESKPTMKPFTMVAEQQKIPLTHMISIGDRREVDLELPVQNGMGGILIETIGDVYELPVLLKR